MATKFVSKNSNYMVVIKPGIEGSRVLGTSAIPGIYVRFQDGVVIIKDEKQIELMREHPAFETDFIEIKEAEKDPYSENRTEIEPDHVQAEINYGKMENRKATAKNVKISPQLKKIIEMEAVKMIPGLLKRNPSILKDILSNLNSEVEATDEAEVSPTDEVISVDNPNALPVKEAPVVEKKEVKQAPKSKK